MSPVCTLQPIKPRTPYTPYSSPALPRNSLILCYMYIQSFSQSRDRPALLLVYSEMNSSLLKYMQQGTDAHSARLLRAIWEDTQLTANRQCLHAIPSHNIGARPSGPVPRIASRPDLGNRNKRRQIMAGVHLQPARAAQGGQRTMRSAWAA